MKISNSSVLKIKKLFLVTMVVIVTISLSLNSVSAKGIESGDSSDESVSEILTGKEANEYLKAVEKNSTFKELSTSGKLVKNNAKVERFELESTMCKIVLGDLKQNSRKKRKGALS
ncbi:hypothetical protein [Oceanobacillus caeni]|uniref:hypothetical protein n=1 Tax=Oceanobacillus caeni TaxID=405946 RepID=UPI0036311AFF